MSQAMNSALNFLPTIVATLGYNPTITLVLTAPPYRMLLQILLLWPRADEENSLRLLLLLFYQLVERRESTLVHVYIQRHLTM
jgi:hypothetical protein